MKKLFTLIILALFLSSTEVSAINIINNDDLFLQKNFKDINSSKDYIDNESPYSEPDVKISIPKSKSKSSHKSFVEIGTKKSNPSKSKLIISSPKHHKKSK